MVQVEDANITGEFVKNLKDRRFVVGAKPYYKEMPDLKDSTKFIRKVVIPVVVYEDRSVLDYIPNKTSIKTMVNLYGSEMDKWFGKFFEWEIAEQKLGGEMKAVIYVKNKKVEMPLENVK